MQEKLTADAQAFFSVHLENDTGKLSPSWSSHEQAEIQFIDNGKLGLYVGNRKYDVAQGNVIVIAPNKLHKVEPVDSAPFSLITVVIHSNIQDFFQRRATFSDLGFLSGITDCPVLRVQGSRQMWISMLFRQLRDEMTKQKDQFASCSVSLLELILVELSRFLVGSLDSMEEPSYEQPDVSRLIKNVIQYINHNYQDDINLSHISKEFWLNPSYLSRQFKNNVGCNITEFITDRRIYHAKTLLLSSDKNISEIALESGFNNIPYFNMVFKNQVGMTPKEFRKKHSQEIVAIHRVEDVPEET